MKDGGGKPGDGQNGRDLEAEVRRLEEELKQSRQSAEHYRIFTELITDFAFVATRDPNGHFNMQWMNGAGEHIFGNTPGQIHNTKNRLATIHPEDSPKMIERLHQLKPGETLSGELRFIRPDESVFWMRVSAKPVFDPASGQIIKLYGVGQDITRSKEEEQALAQNQARFHTLFEESPVALWEEDYSEVKKYLDHLKQSGVGDIRSYFEQRPEQALDVIGLSKVINVNRAALKLRGFSDKENLIAFKNTVVRYDPKRVLMRLEAIAQGLTEFEMEGQSPTKNQGLRYTVWHYSVIPGFEETFGRMIVSIQDVTASRTIESALRQEARRLGLLNSITNISLALGDFRSSVLTLAERMRAFAGADDCFISGWDQEQQIPVFIAGTGDTEERVAGHSIHFGDASITRAVIDTGHTVIIKPEEASAINRRVGTLFGPKAALALPLRIGERKVGSAVLLFKELPQLTPDDIVLWNQIADQVSLAIASLQLYDQSQRRQSELEKLVQISADLRRAETFSEILELLVKEMVRIVGGQTGALIVKRSQKWMLVSEQIHRLDTKMGEIELTDEFIQKILEAAQKPGKSSQQIAGMAQAMHFFQGLGSYAVVPLRTSEGVIGVMAVAWQAGPEVAPENRRLLTTVAEMAGNALQRANLLETLEQRVNDRTRDLQILYDLSALANRSVGLKIVMQRALRELVKVVKGRAGAVYQMSPEENTVEMVVSHAMPAGLDNQLRGVAVTEMRRGDIQQAYEPAYFPDLRLVPDLPPEIIENGLTSAFWRSVYVSGKIWGILVVLGGSSGLKVDEAELLTAVSDLLGSAIENDLLQKKAKGAAVMEERQRLARGLHDSVTQSIYGLTLLAEAGREYAIQGQRDPTLHYLERTSETARQALREMRMLLYEMRPPELEKLGLAGALRYRLESVERRVGIEARIKVKEEASLPANLQEALFWIAQEALNNILKHAVASKVDVNLRAGVHRVRLEIVDNGHGFAPESEAHGGMGLVGMRERTEKIGGRLCIESAPGKGTRVTVEVSPRMIKEEAGEYE